MIHCNTQDGDQVIDIPRTKGSNGRWLILPFVLAFILAFATPAQKIAAQQVPATEPQALEIAYCGERPQKPPLKKLFFNITLHNRSDHARWFLLPRSLYDKPVPL